LTNPTTEPLAEMCKSGYVGYPPKMNFNQYDSSLAENYQAAKVLVTRDQYGDIQTSFHEVYCYKITEDGSYSTDHASQFDCIEENCLKCGTPVDRNFNFWIKRNNGDINCRVCKIGH